MNNEDHVPYTALKDITAYRMRARRERIKSVILGALGLGGLGAGIGMMGAMASHDGSILHPYPSGGRMAAGAGIGGAIGATGGGLLANYLSRLHQDSMESAGLDFTIPELSSRKR